MKSLTKAMSSVAIIVTTMLLGSCAGKISNDGENNNSTLETTPRWTIKQELRDKGRANLGLGPELTKALNKPNNDAIIQVNLQFTHTTPRLRKLTDHNNDVAEIKETIKTLNRSATPKLIFSHNFFVNIDTSIYVVTGKASKIRDLLLKLPASVKLTHGYLKDEVTISTGNGDIEM